MEHILKTSHEELERTHRLLETYKTSGFKEIFFSIFSHSFKKILEKYAYKKEEILMNYSSLYSDMSKDIIDPSAQAIDIESVRESIMYITNTIESCGVFLEHLIAHSHRQEEIIKHEKVFFVNLLESFNIDLRTWVWAHEKEIFWEATNLQEKYDNNPLKAGKELLLLQKKRLESHINNISNIQEND